MRIVARDWLNWARDTIKDRSYPRRFHKRHPLQATYSVFRRFFLVLGTYVDTSVRIKWIELNVLDKMSSTLENRASPRAEKYMCVLSLQLSLQIDVFVYSCCSIFSRSSVSKYSPSTIIFWSVWSRYVVFSLLQQHSGTNKNESGGMKRDYWSFKEPNTKLLTDLTANSATGRFVTICRYRAQICQRNASLNSNSL